MLTSVMKKIDIAVLSTIKDAKNGTFKGGTVTYTIKDGGVDMAPFHNFDSQVPATLKTELDTAKAALSAGSLTVDGVLGQ